MGSATAREVAAIDVAALGAKADGSDTTPFVRTALDVQTNRTPRPFTHLEHFDLSELQRQSSILPPEVGCPAHGFTLNRFKRGFPIVFH